MSTVVIWLTNYPTFLSMFWAIQMEWRRCIWAILRTFRTFLVIFAYFLLFCSSLLYFKELFSVPLLQKSLLMLLFLSILLLWSKICPKSKKVLNMVSYLYIYLDRSEAQLSLLAHGQKSYLVYTFLYCFGINTAILEPFFMWKEKRILWIWDLILISWTPFNCTQNKSLRTKWLGCNQIVFSTDLQVSLIKSVAALLSTVRIRFKKLLSKKKNSI